MGFIVGKHRAAIPLSHGPFLEWTRSICSAGIPGGGRELTREWYQDVLGPNVVSFPIPWALRLWYATSIQSLEDIKEVNYRIYGVGNEGYDRTGVGVVTLPGDEILPGLKEILCWLIRGGPVRHRLRR